MHEFFPTSCPRPPPSRYSAKRSLLRLKLAVGQNGSKRSTVLADPVAELYMFVITTHLPGQQFSAGHKRIRDSARGKSEKKRLKQCQSSHFSPRGRAGKKRIGHCNLSCASATCLGTVRSGRSSPFPEIRAAVAGTSGNNKRPQTGCLFQS